MILESLRDQWLALSHNKGSLTLELTASSRDKQHDGFLN